MGRVLVYSLLLIAGIAVALILPLDPIRPILTTITMICLAYIMIEVGLEFTLSKAHLWIYGRDYLVATIAALLPWALVALYFMWVLHTPRLDAWVIAHFVAPTSAGVLFAMLAAAGLGTSWLFQKARILAIFDVIDTMLILIVLQLVLIGMRWSLIISVPAIIALIWLAYRFLHRIHWPIQPLYLLLYGAGIVFMLEGLEHTVNLQVEIILPAFVWGCMLFNPHDPYRPKEHTHEHDYLEPEGQRPLFLDSLIKGTFMFLVGLTLPPAHFTGITWWLIVVHVAAITVLSNIGKSTPTLFYKGEATWKERVALGVAMYPRGEVGAGVLLVVVDYGLSEEAIAFAEAGLALNLLLTGLFIWVVIKLLPKTPHLA